MLLPTTQHVFFFSHQFLKVRNLSSRDLECLLVFLSRFRQNYTTCPDATSTLRSFKERIHPIVECAILFGFSSPQLFILFEATLTPKILHILLKNISLSLSRIFFSFGCPYDLKIDDRNPLPPHGIAPYLFTTTSQPHSQVCKVYGKRARRNKCVKTLLPSSGAIGEVM